MIYKFILFVAVSFLFNACTSADLPSQKFIKLTKSFLDTPYSLDPLGEGEGGTVDTDPLYRFDKFDCLTFVETALAKFFSHDEDSFKLMMNKIRYKDGIVSFETRNHFQNPDWLRNNSNILQNISNDISKIVLNKDSAKSIINLDRKSWFKQNHNIDIEGDKEVVSLDYITLSDFANNMDAFTNFVKKPYVFMTIISSKNIKEKIGTEFDISHTGFLINKDGVLYLRHASSIAGKITDSNFEEYISSLQKNSKYLGFSLLEIKY